MKTRSKLALAGLVGLLAAGGLVAVPRETPPPAPIDDLAVEPPLDAGSGGELTPYTAYFCCPPDGGPCVDVSENLALCPATDKLVSCGCPASEPDGSVSCGC